TNWLLERSNEQCRLVKSPGHPTGEKKLVHRSSGGNMFLRQIQIRDRPEAPTLADRPGVPWTGTAGPCAPCSNYGRQLMLIVFEGLDGSGKTSLIQLTQGRLKQRPDIDVHVTSELGRSEWWSTEARKAVMKARNKQEQLHIITEARLTHFENVLDRLLSDN